MMIWFRGPRWYMKVTAPISSISFYRQPEGHGQRRGWSRRILTILGQGEMFGEMACSMTACARPRSAVSPSDLVTIAKTGISQASHAGELHLRHVMCNLTRRLRDADRKIESPC